MVQSKESVLGTEPRFWEQYDTTNVCLGFYFTYVIHSNKDIIENNESSKVVLQ